MAHFNVWAGYANWRHHHLPSRRDLPMNDRNNDRKDAEKGLATAEATVKRYPTTTWFFLGALVCELLHLLAGRL